MEKKDTLGTLSSVLLAIPRPMSFRTHVRNLQFSFRVRFFISLRFIQNDMFVIPVCEGSHRKRTIWRKMFHFIGARLE